MLVLTSDIVPDSHQKVGWVNGNLYQRTAEVYGILPIPEDVRTISGMLPYDMTLPGSQCHRYLAQKQGTRKAVLPLHSVTEYQLFSKLIKEHPAFNVPDSREPDWSRAVKVWNHHAELTDNIAYKVRTVSSHDHGA